MDSKQATSSPISESDPASGSSPIKILSSYDSDIENVIENNTLNIDTKNNSNSSGSSSSFSSVSDDSGFVSGADEYDTASEKPVVADPDDETLEKGVEGGDSGDPFVGSSDFSMPKGEMPIAKELADVDYVEKVDKVRVLEGEEVDGDGVLLGKELGNGEGVGLSSVVGNGFTDSNATGAPISKVIGGEGFEGKPEFLGDTMPGENLNSNSNELVKRSVFGVTSSEVLEDSKGDKGAEYSELSEEVDSATKGILMPEEEVDEIKLKGEEPVEDKKIGHLNGENSVTVLEAKEFSDMVEESAVTDRVNADIIEPENSKLVEADGVKFTDEGDSVVEGIHVDLSGPGVTVVGKTEGNEEAVGSVTIINGSNQTSPIVEEETVDSKVIGVDAGLEKNSKLATYNNVETTKLEPIESKPSGAGADKDESLDAGDVVSENVVENIPENVKLCASAEVSKTPHLGKGEKKPEIEIEREADYEAEQNGSLVKIAADGIAVASTGDLVCADGDGVQSVVSLAESSLSNPANEVKQVESENASGQYEELEDGAPGKSLLHESAEPSSVLIQEVILEAEGEEKNDTDEEGDIEGSISDGETDGMIFGSSEAAKQFIEALEQGSVDGSHSGAEGSRDHSQRIDGQIVTDSDEEVDTDEEGDGKDLFDSAALAALLKATTSAGSESGNITITSQDGSRLFSVERPAGLGSSLQSLKPAPRPNRSSLFSPSSLTSGGESDNNLSEEEKKKLEKLQSIRVKFLRLVQRLGLSPDESVAAQVLYRLALVAGRQTGQLFSLDAAKRTALQLEAEGKEDLDFSVNILVIGKSGVGKSATINSIFGEEKALIDAFEPATTTVKEISGMVDGVKIQVFDTPGLKSSVMEQAFSRSVLTSVKKFTKKSPPDIVLYVDRLDAQTRDLNDLPLLRTVTSSLGPSIWRSAIVTLTHAASAPPDGPSGSPLSYEVFVTQRSHVVQQSIGQAVGDLRMMSPSLMNPVSLVENHPSCRKNREGQKVLPNGQSWRPQLLLLCYSMKILSDASSLSKPQDPFDHRKLFGFRVRSPPLPYMLSSMLQSRAHPKLSSDQGGDNGDSDIDIADLSDSDQEEDEDEYDQLPPFKPLRKSQIAKLSKEQRKAYFEEYDYRVKLLQKKQWKEELKRMRQMKKGKGAANDYGYMEEDADSGAAAPVSVPLPDMALPPSFDGDSPAYRYRFLEPTSQFLARPVLDSHGWDHDCGYDGVNLEQSLAIASHFPAVVSVQLTKDKKEFSINLDSSISAKHGENGSSMAGFDIQTIGKQLAYIIRGETKFKNLKKNKTGAGISVTFLGENVATGFKIEDQIALGKQYVLVGSAGTVRSQQDAAYGANFEVQRRELDYPIGQVQSSFGLSIVKWRGDLALVFNSLAQFSIGRNSKVAVRAGINNKLSGQITVRTSSSEHLSLALAGIIPTAIAIYKKVWPGVGEKYSIY